MGNSQGKPVDLNGEVNLNHFRLLRVVGRGAFGKVRIVERKDTGLSFALKYIRKDEVVRSESVRNIIRERRMLEHVNHPFICNLRYSFQDIEYMYLVVDLMSGGDLRFHISRKTFTEDAVRFWIAELGCALRYIHGQGIIHRDVKPDNVLLDADGHVHLTDFNVASDVVPGKLLTSKSGTLAYLAPEVYAGKGYDVRADWWSLGVLFYECIYNKRPFEGNSESTLTNIILAANPKFPVTQPPVSLPCLYAIGSALNPNPDQRLGNTWQSFINEPFFQAIDFAALERKELEPIFVPSADKTNFDATYDLEELLLEEAPLEARARRQKPREKLKDDATEKEIREEELYRTIERDFQPFDYTVAAYKKIAGLKEGEGSEDHESAPGPSHEEPQAISTNEAKPAPTNNGVSQTQHQSPPAQDGSHLNRNFSNNSRAPKAPQRAAPPPLPSYHRAYTKSISSSAGIQVKSPTGGISVTLEDTGSWSDLARRDATLPTDANAVNDDKASSGGGGVFGLFGRKKRGHSPKPKERGVLGKEGARQVVG
ncbi:kinase-like protein [Annulohypoxylon truncatum]|uniref:kinase-like protein n=1 Tax=Annulohypoxylon truncatum TaxID=327061 RepID=UPI002007ACAB|nr:kinase-like protein [Annulohypoxylon truncatum]KAI1211452.1 kinase-like protein [Annulohypoxylon truncatum]